MLLLTTIVADIKTGVYASDLGPLRIFEGPNGSGKSAVLQAIDLLVNGQAGDLRGKDRKAAYYLESLLAHRKTGAITIDGIVRAKLEAHGQACGFAETPVNCVAASGRTVVSWPVGMRDNFTDLWRVSYAFIDASAPVEWVKTMAKIGHPSFKTRLDYDSSHDEDLAFADFNLPGLQLLVQSHEAAAEAVKSAKDEFSQLKDDREVLRRHKAFDAVTTIEAKITKAEAKHAAAKEVFVAVDTKLQMAARTTAEEFDAYCTGLRAFGCLRSRFGRPSLASGINALPQFSNGFPCPFLADSGPMGQEHNFALSGAEEVFVAMWIANGIARLNNAWYVHRRLSAPYMAFLMPDRDYDSDFIDRLTRDASTKTLGMQVFGARSRWEER